MASSEWICAGGKPTGRSTGVRSAAVAAITSRHSLYWPPPIGILLKVPHTQTSPLSGTKRPRFRDKENSGARHQWPRGGLKNHAMILFPFKSNQEAFLRHDRCIKWGQQWKSAWEKTFIEWPWKKDNISIVDSAVETDFGAELFAWVFREHREEMIWKNIGRSVINTTIKLKKNKKSYNSVSQWKKINYLKRDKFNLLLLPKI